jgi:hypothetical protein
MNDEFAWAGSIVTAMIDGFLESGRMDQPEGVILFGSFAQGRVDDKSDIDCLIVFKETCAGRLVFDAGEREVDVVFCSVKALHRFLKKEKIAGNGFFVDVLSRGRFLGRATPALLKIQRDAIELKSAGRDDLRCADAWRIMEKLDTQLRKVKCDRLRDERTDAGERYLYKIRLDKVFENLLQSYLVANNAWFSNPVDNLRKIVGINDEFALTCKKYVQAELDIDRIALISGMIELIRSRLQNLLSSNEQ